MSPEAIRHAFQRAGHGAGLALAILAMAGAALAAEPNDNKKEPPKAQPAVTKAPPAKAPDSLSFTDDDLEKYRHHKPSAAGDDATASEDEQADGKSGAAATAPGSPAAPSAPGASQPANKPARKPAAAPPRPMPPRIPPPAPDPLKPMKDRNALEEFRQNQIQEMRTKIDGLQSRLDYLQAKKNGLQNPAPIEVGRTVAPPKPDISPGHKTQPLGPFFPNLPPAQNDQDREDDKTMKPQALLDKIEEEMKTVESDLEDAKRNLIAVETRFAQEVASK
jgi:hypothetical protein